MEKKKRVTIIDINGMKAGDSSTCTETNFDVIKYNENKFRTLK